MKLFLIDSNSYIYRFYHAVRGLSTSKGFPTNAIYGFTGMLFKLLKDRGADAIVAAFDSASPTVRHIAYAEYKANRPSMPEDLAVQLPLIRQIIGCLGIRVIEAPGYEADDIIGTIAKRASQMGHEVYILSNDKDMLQLVGDNVWIFDPQKDLLIGVKEVVERFDVGPEKIPDIMALAGDSSDNIPGVKGIGDKKAKELIKEAGSLEALINNAQNIRNEKLRALVLDNLEVISLSKRLSVINTNVPLDLDIASLALNSQDWECLRRLFIDLELRGYLKNLPAQGNINGHRVMIINQRQSLISFILNTK